MSSGKLAAQCSHASMAFLTSRLRNGGAVPVLDETSGEVDENGVGKTLTCIGFRPLPDEVAHQISRKYQLFK